MKLAQTLWDTQHLFFEVYGDGTICCGVSDKTEYGMRFGVSLWGMKNVRMNDVLNKKVLRITAWEGSHSLALSCQF